MTSPNHDARRELVTRSFFRQNTILAFYDRIGHLPATTYIFPRQEGTVNVNHFTHCFIPCFQDESHPGKRDRNHRKCTRLPGASYLLPRHDRFRNMFRQPTTRLTKVKKGFYTTESIASTEYIQTTKANKNHRHPKNTIHLTRYTQL